MHSEAGIVSPDPTRLTTTGLLPQPPMLDSTHSKRRHRQGLVPANIKPVKPHLTSPRQRDGYLPTLDGWRAVAITAVILFHTGLIPQSHLYPWRLQRLGAYGVQLFFAISGLLICSRLLDEEKHTGRISLQKFFLRRIFRIQPAAFVFLFALAALAALSIIPFDTRGWLLSLASARNLYQPHGVESAALYTSHFWSLAIEEHFYLILPFCLVLIKPRFRLPLFTFLAFSSMSLYVAFNQNATLRPPAFSELEMCWLFFAAWLALFLQPGHIREAFRRSMPATPAFVVMVLIVGAMLAGVPHVQHLFFPFMPILVMATTLHPSSLISRLLETYPLRMLGRISYSLYLWQMLFCVHPTVPLATPWLRQLQQTPVNWLCSLAFAIASYILVEEPMIRLGHRLATPPTPGHRDLASPSTTTAPQPPPPSSLHPDTKPQLPSAHPAASSRG